MPSGKYLSEEEKARISRLKAQGVTAEMISVRTGLCRDTVYRIVKEGEANENPKGTPTKGA